MSDRLAPVHPGEVLREEFLAPLSVSAAALASAMDLAAAELEPVLAGVAPVTAELALRLNRALGPDARFWLNLQAQYDLACVEDAIGDRLSAVRRLEPAE